MMPTTLSTFARRVSIKKNNPEIKGLFSWKLWIYPSKAYSTILKRTAISDNMKKLNLEKQNKILKIVNESDTTELSKYIKQLYAKSIITHRNTFGPFKSLDDLLLLDQSIGDGVNQLCISIMQDNMDEMKPNYKITPNVQMKQMPKTTLGIHVGPTLISWALVDCNLNVLVWNYKHWHGIGPRKNSYNIIKLVPCVLESIPAAENYIMEDIKFSKNTIAPYILHAQQQLSLSIMTCLTLRNETSETLSSAHNVYVLHPQTTVRYFNALHNFQNIDTNYLVDVTPTSSVIRISDTKSIDIYLNSDVKNKYLSASIDDQEQMRWPLLKVLAYLRIFAIKNHDYNWYF